MKNKTSQSIYPLVLFLVTSLLLIQSCNKLPTPSFTFDPSENPEAGDSIFFINVIEEGVDYSWDFGDENTSNDPEPFHIYDEKGTYAVSLTATNENGGQILTQNLIINQPTVLEFKVFESDSTTVLVDCELIIYNSLDDYENEAEPLFTDYTNSEGIVSFSNLEAQEYFIIAFKPLLTGYWITGGRTQPLDQNETSLYWLVCKFIDNPSKSSSIDPESAKTPFLPQIRDITLNQK